jgi:hypothetical protein
MSFQRFVEACVENKTRLVLKNRYYCCSFATVITQINPDLNRAGLALPNWLVTFPSHHTGLFVLPCFGYHSLVCAPGSPNVNATLEVLFQIIGQVLYHRYVCCYLVCNWISYRHCYERCEVEWCGQGKVKGKGVPLHAMEAHWGRGGIAMRPVCCGKLSRCLNPGKAMRIAGAGSRNRDCTENRKVYHAHNSKCPLEQNVCKAEAWTRWRANYRGQHKMARQLQRSAQDDAPTTEVSTRWRANYRGQHKMARIEPSKHLKWNPQAR